MPSPEARTSGLPCPGAAIADTPAARFGVACSGIPEAESARRFAGPGQGLSRVWCSFILRSGDMIAVAENVISETSETQYGQL